MTNSAHKASVVRTGPGRSADSFLLLRAMIIPNFSVHSLTAWLICQLFKHPALRAAAARVFPGLILARHDRFAPHPLELRRTGAAQFRRVHPRRRLVIPRQPSAEFLDHPVLHRMESNYDQPAAGF